LQYSILDLVENKEKYERHYKYLQNLYIPLPPFDIQQKIISKIEVLEMQEKEAKEKMKTDKSIIQELINTSFLQYETRLLGDLCESVEYGTSAKSEKKGDIPVIRMGNIQDGKIDWNDLVYTSNPDEISKYSLKTNDILFNRTNSPELVGKAGIYKGEQPAIFAGYLIRINYKKDLLDPVFLTYILNSKTMRDHGFSVMSKSVNQANINGSLLKAYRIPCPSLSEQQEIVSEIENIEAQIAEAQKIMDDIPIQKNKILKKYL
jgi:restriction endonuclease S subunit